MAKQTLPMILLCAALGAGPITISMGAEPAASPLFARRGAGVVSTVDFYARMAQIPESDRKAVLRDQERMKDILRSLLLRSQLAADARAAGFDREPLIAARMRKSAESTLANIWLEHYIDQQAGADYEALALESYLVQQANFVSVKRVDVTHLLISTREQTQDEARSVAEALLLQVEAEPARFDALVVEYSQDPSVASNQGRFLNVKTGDMVPAFEGAAFALHSPGEFSGLVTSAFGFHIIRLDGIHLPEQLPFAAVRKDLLARERHKHRERKRNEYLSSLAMLEVEINDAEMQKLLRQYFQDENQNETVDQADIE